MFKENEKEYIRYFFFKKLLIFLAFIKISVVKSECSKDEPIEKDGNCSLIYCTEEEYSINSCSISNSIIKDQWLNNIILLNNYNLRYNNFAINSKGDLILKTSQENTGIRYFYGLTKNGDFYFTNEYNEKMPTKVIIVKDGDNNEIRPYDSQILFISLNNSKNVDDNQYLINIGSNKNGYTEFYDFKNDNVASISSTNFLGNEIYSTHSTFMELKNENENIKEYIYIFAGQDENDVGTSNYRMLLHKYAFNNNKFLLDDAYTYKEVKTNGYTSKVISCFQTDSNILIVFYLTGPKKYYIRSFNSDLIEKYNETIGTVTKIQASVGLYYYSIKIKNNLGAFIYFLNNEANYPEFSIKEINDDYKYTTIFQLSLNFGYEFNNEPLYNNLMKLNDNRISYISTSKNKCQLLIVLFDLYNNDQNIKIRIFKIELLKLYNYQIYKEIKTIVYNDYLTLSSSINNLNDNQNYFSLLLIFGYVNGTDSYIDISLYLNENNINHDNNNIIIKLQEKTEINNNIFGYELTNEIKLIYIPDELLFYNIQESGIKTRVNNGDILINSHEIIQNYQVMKINKTYSLKYQLIVKEPALKKFDQYASDIFYYPENPEIDQNDEIYENKKYFGRTTKVEFKLCFQTCSTCQYLGASINEQKCLTCFENHDYFKITGNCVPESHYIDKELGEFKKCDIDSKFYIDESSGKKICFKKEYSCPKNYPYLLKDNKECKYNNPYEENEINKNTVLYNTIKNSIIDNYNLNETLILKSKDNYIFQLTNTLNEENIESNTNSNNNLSRIDLGNCEKILKEKYNIDDDIPLIILKFEKAGELASNKNIQYEVYNPINKKKLNLFVCKNEKINIYIPIDLNEKTLDLYDDLQSYGYDLFNPNDSFYQDICFEYTTINGTDILLSDRRKYFFNDTETSCQAGCEYSQYNKETKKLKCECSINENNGIEPENEIKFDGNMFFSSFYDVLKYSNILILKCYNLFFSSKGQTKNYGSILMIGFFITFTIINLFFFKKGISKLEIYEAKLIFNNSPNNIEENNNNNEDKSIKSKINISSMPPKRKQVDKDIQLKIGNNDTSSENRIKNENNENKYNQNNTLNDNHSDTNNGFQKIEKKNQSKTPNQFMLRPGTKSKTLGNLNLKKRKKINDNNNKDNMIRIINNKNDNNNLNIINDNINENVNNNNFISSNNNINLSNSFNTNINDNNSNNINNNIINNNINNNSNHIINNHININNKVQNIIIFEHKNNEKNKQENRILNCCIKGNNFHDFELNELEYYKAVRLDHRTFIQYYWQLLRREHIIIFTFFVKDDFNIFYIKLSLFIFRIVIDFGLNVLFFIDDSMNKIYLDYGKYNFLAQIPQIIYSTLLTEILDILLRYLCLTEKDMYLIQKYSKKMNKSYYKKKIFKIFNYIKIKLICYFVFSFFLMIFFWYFVCAFCAVYKNTQSFLLKDFFLSYFLSLLYPIALYILPASLRILSLKDKKKRLYIFFKLSDIIPII